MQGEDSKCLENLARYVKDEFKNKKNEEVSKLSICSSPRRRR